MKNYPYSNSNCSVTNNNTQDCSLNNASMKNMHRSMNRNQLMEHINQVSFAVDEVLQKVDKKYSDVSKWDGDYTMDLTSETKGKATIELFVNGKSVKKDTVKFK